MSRSSSRLTSGLSRTPRTKLKIAALAPMPSAIVKITVSVRPLVRMSERIANFMPDLSPLAFPLTRYHSTPNALFSGVGADCGSLVSRASPAEMIEPERLERRSPDPHGSGAALHDRADARQRNTFELARHALAGGHREQQFVILSTVQRLLHGRPREPGRRFDGGASFGRQAQASQIERQPVAQIHSCGGMQPLAQETAERQARFGPRVAPPRRSAPPLQPQSRAA